MKIATAQEMRDIDKSTIEWFGLPGVALMENAGHAIADKAVEILGEPRGKIVFIVCGGGNNGGDGFVNLSASEVLISQGLDAYFVSKEVGRLPYAKP